MWRQTSSTSVLCKSLTCALCKQVTGRKVGMVLISVMLARFGPGVQALVALLLVQVAIVLHVQKEPYSYEAQDRLEMASLGCSFLCLIGGLVFWSQDIADGDTVTETTDFASLILTFTIVGLNGTVFVYVAKQVLIAEVHKVIHLLQIAWKKRKARKLAAKGASPASMWFRIKSCVRALRCIYKCKRNKAKVYSADEVKQMKVANNARLKVRTLYTTALPLLLA